MKINRIVLIILLISSSCSESLEKEEKTAENGYSGLSLFHLDSEWKDQDNNPFYLKDLEGKTIVVAMVYTSCTLACPVIVSDMKNIENSVDPEFSPNVEFVLISFDPEVDIPEKLKQFAMDSGLDKSNWILLNGSESSVREMAAVLNVKYKKTTDVHYAHSNIISILDLKGEISFQSEGLGKDPEIIVNKINALSDED